MPLSNCKNPANIWWCAADSNDPSYVQANLGDTFIIYSITTFNLEVDTFQF